MKMSNVDANLKKLIERIEDAGTITLSMMTIKAESQLP
jgi:hypothetical protein